MFLKPNQWGMQENLLVKNQERLQMVLALPMSNDVKWCSGVIIVKT